MDADLVLDVLENPGTDPARVGGVECPAQRICVHRSVSQVALRQFREQIGGVHHHFLGGLEGLWFDLGEEMARELIETQRDDEGDEEQRDPGEAHLIGKS